MLNSSSNNEEMDLEVRPGGMLVQGRDGDDHNDGPLIRINVSHGPARHEVFVPAQSTFGYMKKVLEPEVGLEPQQQKILFRGKEKGDEEYLHESGVKDKSKVLLLEDTASEKKKLEEIQESEGTSNSRKGEEIMEEVEMSRALHAIDEIRAEIDKLAERVAALEAVVNGGTKISDDEFVVLSELLMRQLLKLDTIQAEGEAKVQRKAEVRRVQKFHDRLDGLKTRNAKLFDNNGNAVTVTTEWETFDSGLSSTTPASPATSSSTRITEDWERFD